MEEEIKNEVVQSEVEIMEDTDLSIPGNSPVVEESNSTNEVKCENIYVENDPEDLERMLGIAPSKEEIKEDGEFSNNEEESSDEETKEDSQENSITNDKEDSEEESLSLEEPEEDTQIEDKIKPVMFSDFMDEDRESFTYLENINDSYHVNSVPLNDKSTIRKIVKSPNYIFRYPKYILRDKVLGYTLTESKGCLRYDVFFPEYKFSFNVGEGYAKAYSESFKEYFEDLINRVRPENMNIQKYEKSITLKALKVIETGVLEMQTDKGIKTFLLVNPDVSFHRVLDYIRELSDMGEDTLTLKFIPEFFVEL